MILHGKLFKKLNREQKTYEQMSTEFSPEILWIFHRKGHEVKHLDSISINILTSYHQQIRKKISDKNRWSLSRLVSEKGMECLELYC